MNEQDLLPPQGFRQRGPLPRGSRLVLIRHGECYANALGVAGGPLGDGGLTATGRRQAGALATRLAMSHELRDAAAFYTSTLPRAIETGSLVFPTINVSLVPEARRDLEELDVGQADGLGWAEIVARFPPVDWDVDPTQPCAPGGESLIGFYERCVRAIAELVRRHPHERVVAVVHGGVIEQAMKIHLGVGATARLGLRTEHCSITEIEFHEGATRLLSYNDQSPLPA